MSEDNSVGTVSLGGSSWLAFSVSQWRGRYFAGVRKFVATQMYDGPTKSGLTFNRNMLHELVAALERLEKVIPSEGESVFKIIPKNETENINIRIVPDEESEALPSVDIREFIDTPRYQGPTKRGIRFRWDLLPEVLACLRKQAKVINETEKNEPSLFSTDLFKPKQEQEWREGQSEPASLQELLGEDLKQFPTDFLGGFTGKSTRVKVPEEPLRLEQDNTGAHILKTEDGIFAKVRNPTEGNFIIFAQLRGHREVLLPAEMIDIFRTVKSYENYLRILRSRLFAKILKKARQESIANYETDKIFRSLGLPKLEN